MKNKSANNEECGDNHDVRLMYMMRAMRRKIIKIPVSMNTIMKIFSLKHLILIMRREIIY